MDLIAAQPHVVHYIPIATTVLSIVFCGVLFGRYRSKGKGAHLLWWAAGISCYGLGTGLEAAVTLLGNSVWLTKSWYVAGAILGGYPLAQGTVYLLLRRRTAHILTAVSLPVIIAVSILVILSPVNLEALEPHRPNGAVLGWQWVRLMTPLVNGYAALFLIGGAVLSAVRFAKFRDSSHRAIGNTLIAVGALLPGIGGSMAKAGIIEALYVGEFVGLLLIWAGYRSCVRPQILAGSVPETVQTGRPSIASGPGAETCRPNARTSVPQSSG